MAKANVGKFYEKLGKDAALAEKLNEMDKAFVEYELYRHAAPGLFRP